MRLGFNWAGLGLLLCLWTSFAPALSNIFMLGCRSGVGGGTKDLATALKAVDWSTVFEGVTHLNLEAVWQSFGLSDFALTSAGILGVALLAGGRDAGRRLTRVQVLFFGFQPLLFGGSLVGLILLPALPRDLINPSMMWFEDGSIFLVSGALWVIGSATMSLVIFRGGWHGRRA